MRPGQAGVILDVRKELMECSAPGPPASIFFLYNVDTVRVSQFAKLGLGYAGTNMDCLKASRKAVGVPILHCNNCHSLKLQ